MSIAVIVCHYNPKHSYFLRSLANLCVSSIQKEPDPDIIVFLCDGSPEPDYLLAEDLKNNNIAYLHAGRNLSFGETYNLGIKNSMSENIVLVANDILISSSQIKRLVAELQGNIACTFPYLSEADYITQTRSRVIVPHMCFPASMTINVNAFRRDVLHKIGNVPEELSGFFNDVIMFYRMRSLGYRVGLVNVGKVNHIGKLTRNFSSNVYWQNDLRLAAELAPLLFSGKSIQNEQYWANNYWARIFSRSAQNFFSKYLWLLLGFMPVKLNQFNGIGYWASKIEPYLSIDYQGFRKGVLTISRNLRSRMKC